MHFDTKKHKILEIYKEGKDEQNANIKAQTLGFDMIICSHNRTILPSFCHILLYLLQQILHYCKNASTSLIFFSKLATVLT